MEVYIKKMPTSQEDLDRIERLELQLRMSQRKVKELEHQRITLAQQVERQTNEIERLKSGSFESLATLQHHTAYVSKTLEETEVLRLQVDELEDVLPTSVERTHFICGQIVHFEKRKEDMEERLRLAEEELLIEFQTKAASLCDTFDACAVPTEDGLSFLHEKLGELIEGQYAEVICPSELDQTDFFTDMNERPPRMSPSNANGPSSSSSNVPTPVGSLGATGSMSPRVGSLVRPGSYPLVEGYLPSSPLSCPSPHGKYPSGPFFRDSAPSLDRASSTGSLPSSSSTTNVNDVDQRRILAKESLLPILRNVSLDEAVVALEECGNDVNTALVSLMAREPLDSNLIGGTQLPPTPTSSSRSSRGGCPMAHGSTVVPSESQGRERDRVSRSHPRIVIHITRVLPTGEVTFSPMLDRNQVPLLRPPSDEDTSMCISAHILYKYLGLRLLTPDEQAGVNDILIAPPPTLVFRPMGSSFRLLEVLPPLPLSQYEIEYDPDSKELLAVVHNGDGPIQFTAYRDMNEEEDAGRGSGHLAVGGEESFFQQQQRSRETGGDTQTHSGTTLSPSPSPSPSPLTEGIPEYIQVFTLYDNDKGGLQVVHVHLGAGAKANAKYKVVERKKERENETFLQPDTCSLGDYVIVLSSSKDRVSDIYLNEGKEELTNVFFMETHLSPPGASVSLSLSSLLDQSLPSGLSHLFHVDRYLLPSPSSTDNVSNAVTPKCSQPDPCSSHVYASLVLPPEDDTNMQLPPKLTVPVCCLSFM